MPERPADESVERMEFLLALRRHGIVDQAVLRAMDRDRYEPYLVYIDRAGRWLLPAGPAPALAAGERLAGLLGAATPAEEVRRLRAVPQTV